MTCYSIRHTLISGSFKKRFLFRCSKLLLEPTIRFSKINLKPQNLATCTLRSETDRLYSQLSDAEQKNSPAADGDKPYQYLETTDFIKEDNKNRENVPSVETSTNSIPWYLRVETPEVPEKPFSKRLSIPDLPKLSPPILQPLLNHLSIDLGLDYISLLDLRKLDPPPSLGANLLMLIGTARSEKHLNVAADQLCRWLRSEYKLCPDADGLLGRNELKMRLKRKAKKTKFLEKNSEKFDDDGIQSGWICVDAGLVKNDEVAVEATSPEDFIGFSNHVTGVRIVVQLLTQEKRKEVALEKLWNVILKRGGQLERSEYFDEEGFLIEDDSPKDSINSSKSNFISVHGKKRTYHTSSRCFLTTQGQLDSIYPQSSEPNTDISSLHEILSTFFGVTSYPKEVPKTVAELLELLNYNTRSGNKDWRSFLQEALISYLKSVSKAEANQLLGSGASDTDSTRFLACYYMTRSTQLTEAQAASHIEFLCYGHSVGHHRYNINEIVKYQKKLVLDNIKISLKSYMLILECILSSGNPDFPASSAAFILSNMHDQGYDIINEDILVFLQLRIDLNDLHRDTYTGSEHKSSDQIQTFVLDLPSVTMPVIKRRMHFFMLNFESQISREENRILLLKHYAERGYWLQFWEIFDIAPRHGQSQSEKIYAHMFNLISKTNNQKACQTVLKTWFPKLTREHPKFVLNSKLADAVRACLLLSIPNVKEQAESGEIVQDEFISMWRRCNQSTDLD